MVDCVCFVLCDEEGLTVFALCFVASLRLLQVDLKCRIRASGGDFFPDHLPVLGNVRLCTCLYTCMHVIVGISVSLPCVVQLGITSTLAELCWCDDP